MGNLPTEINILRKNCFMASPNLSDVNYFIPISKRHHIYFMFSCEGKLHKLLYPSSDITCSPRMFTKRFKLDFLKHLSKLGHEIIGNLDDSFCVKTLITFDNIR